MKCADKSYLFDDLCKTMMQSQGYISRLAKLNAQDTDLQAAADDLESAIKHVVNTVKNTDTWLVA